MRGLKLFFADGGADIQFDEVGDDYELTAQKVAVAVATNKGTDSIFSDRGSSILQKGVTNVIYDVESAKQEAAMISLQTRKFLNLTSDVALEDPITKIELVPRFENLQYLTLSTNIEYASGAKQESHTELSV